MSESQVIANEIIKQLGGFGKLSAMVGANNFVALESGLQFGFKGSAKVNKIVVKLDPSDTYTVEFWKITKKAFNLIDSSDMIYADMLKPIFEKITGLYLSL